MGLNFYCMIVIKLDEVYYEFLLISKRVSSTHNSNSETLNHKKISKYYLFFKNREILYILQKLYSAILFNYYFSASMIKLTMCRLRFIFYSPEEIISQCQLLHASISSYYKAHLQHFSNTILQNRRDRYIYVLISSYIY